MLLRPVPTRSAPLSGTEIRWNGSLLMAGISWHPELLWECHSTITSALVSIPSPHQPWSVWAATLYTTALPALGSIFLIWWRAPYRCPMRRRHSTNLWAEQLCHQWKTPVHHQCSYLTTASLPKDARYVTQGQDCRHSNGELVQMVGCVWGLWLQPSLQYINLATIPKLIWVTHCLQALRVVIKLVSDRFLRKESVPKRKLGKMPMLPQLRRRRLRIMTRFTRHGFWPSSTCQCPWVGTLWQLVWLVCFC